jgi:hypothetical protein
MADLRIQAAMSALIDGTFGCLDAAAETINARLGASVSKGTLSKMMAGQLHWPAVYIWALEDAAGRYPVSNIRAHDRTARAPAPAESLQTLTARAAKEAGEAVAVAIPLCETATPAQLAAALQEVREAREAMAALSATLEARLDQRGGA